MELVFGWDCGSVAEHLPKNCLPPGLEVHLSQAHQEPHCLALYQADRKMPRAAEQRADWVFS